MTERYVLGNWKSNTTLSEASALSKRLATIETGNVVVGVAPPFPWIAEVRSGLIGSPILIGAQTCSATNNGAFTGEVTAGMIAELCEFVLIGHSERRALFAETDEIVRQKLTRVLETNLVPVLCVGESLDHRHAGRAVTVVGQQLRSALTGLSASQLAKLVVAYEPVWAIGTGLTASVDDATQMGTFICQTLDELGLPDCPVLYGGSVNAANSASLIAAEGISGFLVGGASLKVDEFSAIVASAIAG